jgi:hypothetical protein
MQMDVLQGAGTGFGRGCILNGNGGKPKRMRWRTFERRALHAGNNAEAWRIRRFSGVRRRSLPTFAALRPQSSLIVSPKTFSSASINSVPAKIVGIDVGISGFPFNLSSWYLV